MAVTGDQFDTFHNGNPHVYDVLVRLCREWRAAHPDKHCGIDSMFGAARWSVMLTTDDDEYKLRNDFKPFYARLIMHREADLKDIFVLRPAREADLWLARLVGLEVPA